MKNNEIGPALFFFTNGGLLFRSCSLEDAEDYGNFKNYPHSHNYIWQKFYVKQYGVDFDYFPRGRVIYRKSDDTYLIYYDRCMERDIDRVTDMYKDKKYILSYDEHYQCHMCNEGYVV